ncbi:MAG: hypothetical protein KAI66_07555, partial [Lentisphaeria bacterium]|nr:hypothetical protein [Lentisphaeria bacterium]
MNRSKSVFSPSLMGTSRWLLGAMLCLSALLRAAEPLAVQEWEGLVPDPALVVDGKPALAWANPAERTTVTAQNLAHDLSGFHTLRFRIHVAEPRDSVISLIFDSGNPDTPKGDYYSVSIKTDFSGWRTFEFPLSLIGSTRKPLGWHAIRKVFFNSMWSHHFEPDTVVHLAGFVLDPTPIPGLDQPVGELLKNRGFEIVAGSRPAAWSVSTYSSAARAETDDAEASSGQRSLHIVGAPSARAGASVSFGSELTDPNSLYLLSAQVKVEGTSQHALRTSARFTSVDVDGKVVKSDYKMCPLGPFDWRALAWIVQLPPATHRFNLVLFHHGEGGVWWDDVSLLKLRPVKALAPAVNVASADCRPEFRWEAPADSASTLVVTAESGSDFHVSYDVIGNRFRPEKAFPEGRSYRWHVIVSQGDEPGLAGFKGEDGYMQGTFFAGSFARRVKIMLGDLAPYRKLYAELKPFADRNGMWDRFSLLGDLLANVDSLERDGRLPDGVNLEKMLQDAQELRLRAPWWRKIFLDTGSLMADLDLERPGLEQVREAVGKGDFRAARETLVAYYRQRKAPSYYQKWERRPSINPARTTDTRAEKLLTHKMSIHSYKEPTFDLGREFDWHIFPIVDVEWPTKIHRNFHWSKLAGAYWATDNEAYANEMVQQLLDFAQDNPMERWDRHRHRWAWSTLNATVRIYSTWLNSWLRVRGSKSWTADAQFVMLTELREHGRFLMTHHARHGNWVVAEARGLVELGVMFPEFKEAAEWRAEGFQRLLREIDIQVLSDGVHVERTPGYHSMTMSCFLEPLRLAMLNDVDFEGRENFLAKIESMYEFYLYGARPDLRMA